MKTLLKISLFIIALSFSSCEKLVMHSQPGTDNLSIFNEYAKICIEKFGLEQVKGVNLTELADSIRPYVTDNLSEQELFDLMGIFVDRMQEGHTSLKTIKYDPDFIKSYYYFIGYPPAYNFLIARDKYYGIDANADVQIIAPEEDLFELWYGFLPQDPEIGYIRILSFNMNISDAQLETMMAYLKDAKGLIIDVRGNFGGYMELVGRLCGYFTTTEVMVGRNYIKNGPGKNDFAVTDMKLQPSGSAYAYTKPVAVLHDRVTFSSGSLFCLTMKALPNVTTIGQVYGGGTGEIVDGFLANGWKWTISSANFLDLQGRPTDPGIEADIPMIINPSDTATDAIIERAILELQ
jgi:hypothetical protein